MKKAFLALFVAGLATSCSTDDDNSGSQQQDHLLVKKITQTTYDDDFSETTVTDFIYDGNNLIRFGSALNYTELTYIGTLLTTAKNYNNGVLENENTFTFSGDKLANVTSDSGERTVFEYSGGNVSQIKSQYFDEDVWVTQNTQNFQYSNGNVTQMTASYDYGSGFTGDYRYTFSPDNKNNPFLYMHQALRQLLPLDGILPMSKNNALASEYYWPSNAPAPETSYVYEIVYNADNFPTSIKRKTSGGVLVTETLFEYQ